MSTLYNQPTNQPTKNNLLFLAIATLFFNCSELSAGEGRIKPSKPKKKQGQNTLVTIFQNDDLAKLKNFINKNSNYNWNNLRTGIYEKEKTTAMIDCIVTNAYNCLSYLLSNINPTTKTPFFNQNSLTTASSHEFYPLDYALDPESGQQNINMIELLYSYYRNYHIKQIPISHKASYNKILPTLGTYWSTCQNLTTTLTDIKTFTQNNPSFDWTTPRPPFQNGNTFISPFLYIIQNKKVKQTENSLEVMTLICVKNLDKIQTQQELGAITPYFDTAYNTQDTDLLGYIQSLQTPNPNFGGINQLINSNYDWFIPRGANFNNTSPILYILQSPNCAPREKRGPIGPEEYTPCMGIFRELKSNLYEPNADILPPQLSQEILNAFKNAGVTI